MFIDLREEERKNHWCEKHRSAASPTFPDQGLNPQPRYVPDWELNPQPIGVWGDIPTTEQPSQAKRISFNNITSDHFLPFLTK